MEPRTYGPDDPYDWEDNEEFATYSDDTMHGVAPLDWQPEPPRGHPQLLTLPDLTDDATVQQFILRLTTQYAALKGAKKVARALTQYLSHRRLAAKHLAQARKSIDVINGIRAPYRHRPQHQEILARRFFQTLPTSVLRRYCAGAGLDEAHYATREQVIDALLPIYAAQQTQTV